MLIAQLVRRHTLASRFMKHARLLRIVNDYGEEIDLIVRSSACVATKPLGHEPGCLMEQHQGLAYQRDAVRRQPFALRSSCFVNESTDDLSIAMVKRM